MLRNWPPVDIATPLADAAAGTPVGGSDPLKFFTRFSCPREKRKWLAINHLRSIFIVFFTIFEKTFRVPLFRLSQLCPTLVPRIEWDTEAIETRVFSPCFWLCPAH